MKKRLDEKEFARAMALIAINVLVNDYAVERVAFGYDKIGDKVPVELYIKHLRLTELVEQAERESVSGVYIDDNGYISAEQDYGGYVRDLFVRHMETVFAGAPKDAYLESTDAEIPLPAKFREYLFGLLPIFKEVLEIEAECDSFDFMPSNKPKQSMWGKLVTAILLESLPKGSRINGYINDLELESAPYYIKRLIENKGDDYYLKIADIQSTEYIFALFSLIKFVNGKNDLLFEIKMREWERRHGAGVCAPYEALQ